MQNSTRNCPVPSRRKQQLFLVFCYLGQIDIQLLFSFYLSLFQYLSPEKNVELHSTLQQSLQSHTDPNGVVHVAVGWGSVLVLKAEEQNLIKKTDR